MSSTHRHRLGLGLLMLCLWTWLPSPGMAIEESPPMPFVEREPWKEQGVALPPYPDGKRYVAVPAQIAGSNLEMFVEEPSLSIGEDGVVRYVLMLRSPTGTENLFYEGIRCATQEWRGYAYGTSAGTWQAQGDTPWDVISDRGVERYRLELYRHYLCDPTVGPRERKEMFRRMRYGLPPNETLGIEIN